MHGSIESNCFISISDQFVLLLKDLDQRWRQLVLIIIFLFVGVFAHLQEETIIVDLLQFFFVLLNGAADQSVLFKLFRSSVGGVDKGADCVTDLAGWVVLMQFSLDPFLGHLPAELD